MGIKVDSGESCRDPFHCPAPEGHGNPFRYCPHCNWIEPPAAAGRPTAQVELPDPSEYGPDGSPHWNAYPFVRIVNGEIEIGPSEPEQMKVNVIEAKAFAAALLAAAAWLEAKRSGQ
ncbi:hypothetical protein [Mycolicibacterium sphagni]|uniref:hypothetical protein n=1 Tax=Mycolicibacterium sphagni TaxID=1786 RepID=UPI0021F3739E|nr:hypothetical protein [Mycolicibacterium sphagni]MCV7174775.1 hypothetical protein [Mycolicibacterium sphagni]